MFLGHFKTAYGARRNIEHYLTIGNKVLWDFNTGIMGIDDNVRGAIVIHYPVIECSKQVGSIGPHLHLDQLGANFALEIGETLLE